MTKKKEKELTNNNNNNNNNNNVEKNVQEEQNASFSNTNKDVKNNIEDKKKINKLIKIIGKKKYKLTDAYLTKSFQQEVGGFASEFGLFKNNTISNIIGNINNTKIIKTDLSEIDNVYKKYQYILLVKKIGIIVALNLLNIFLIFLNALYSIFNQLFKYRIIFIVIFIFMIILFGGINNKYNIGGGQFFSLFTFGPYTYPDYLISLFMIIPIVILIFYLELFFIDILIDTILSFDDATKLKLKYLLISIVGLLVFHLFF